jgi:RNA polymerase sigma-70 factor (ECF subfamily)
MKDRNEAFEDAFAAYGDELFRHAYFRLSDRDKAVDMVQECFLRAYGYAKESDILDMRAFLYRTLRHLIIDEYRRKKSYSLDALIEDEEVNTESMLPVDDTNTLEAATDRLDAKAVLAKLPELPPQYGEVLTLRYIDGLTPKEISERIAVSENLVSVRIHRALKALRTLFDTP